MQLKKNYNATKFAKESKNLIKVYKQIAGVSLKTTKLSLSD